MSDSIIRIGQFERHSLSLVRIATRSSRPSNQSPVLAPLMPDAMASKPADLRVMWARNQDEVRLAQRLR